MCVDSNFLWCVFVCVCVFVCNTLCVIHCVCVCVLCVYIVLCIVWLRWLQITATWHLIPGLGMNQSMEKLFTNQLLILYCPRRWENTRYWHAWEKRNTKHGAFMFWKLFHPHSHPESSIREDLSKRSQNPVGKGAIQGAIPSQENKRQTSRSFALQNDSYDLPHVSFALQNNIAYLLHMFWTYPVIMDYHFSFCKQQIWFPPKLQTWCFFCFFTYSLQFKFYQIETGL